MTNEEKILALLEKMDGRISSIESKVGSMDGSMGLMDGRLDSMDSKMNSMGNRLISLEEGQKTTTHLLDIVAAQVNNLTIDVEEIKIELDQKADKTDIVRLENEVLPKIDALFDGQQLNSEKLERIEIEVSRHEEVILRRLK